MLSCLLFLQVTLPTAQAEAPDLSKTAAVLVESGPVAYNPDEEVEEEEAEEDDDHCMSALQLMGGNGELGCCLKHSLLFLCLCCGVRCCRARDRQGSPACPSSSQAEHIPAEKPGVTPVRNMTFLETLPEKTASQALG